MIDKICTKCFIELKQVHPNTKFCNECKIEKSIQYTQEYREKNKDKLKLRYEANKEKYNTQKRNHRLNDPTYKDKQLKYRNSEKGKETRRKYLERLKTTNPQRYESMISYAQYTNNKKKQQVNNESNFKSMMMKGYTFQ